MHYASALAGNDALADDLVQQACISLWRRGLLHGRSRDLVRAALRTAVRFQFLEYRRQLARQPFEQSERWAEAVDRAWRDVGLSDGVDPWLAALRRCRDGMPGPMRRVARWFYEDERSRQEIAQRLGMKETGVKTMLQRMRARLRKCVERRMF